MGKTRAKVPQLPDWVNQTPGFSNDPNYISAIERESGIRAPQFESIRDPVTGELQAGFQIDPSKLEAYQNLRQNAFAQGPSTYAQRQLDYQNLQQQGQMSDAAKQQAQAIGIAQGNLMRSGGVGSGARGLMAAQGAKDLMLAKQRVGREGMLQRAGIVAEDENSKRQLMGTVADKEFQMADTNLKNKLEDVTQKRLADTNRYNQIMQAWASNKSAAAQASAARSAGKKK